MVSSTQNLIGLHDKAKYSVNSGVSRLDNWQISPPRATIYKSDLVRSLPNILPIVTYTQTLHSRSLAMVSHKVGTKKEHDTGRLAILEAEKELTRKNDEVTNLRRDLPWVQLEQDYKFQSASGTVSLSDLFKDGKKDLVVVHFMYEPEWDNGCSHCSCWAEGYNQQLPFYQDRFNFAVVAKASIEKLTALVEKKGWLFSMYSSEGSTFNKDFEVEDTVGKSAGEEFPLSQAPGVSVFRFEDGVLYHTYSAYRRGLEKFNPIWSFMDLLPEGRGSWYPKHKEDYEKKD